MPNTEKKRKPIDIEPSLEAQERLIQIMNDSPKVVSFAGTPWEIKALKPGTQWLIAQEAVSIQKASSANFGDVIKQFAVNTPSVAKVITLGLLNDRRRIFENGTDGAFSNEFQDTYNTVLWDTDQDNWMGLLLDIINLLDVEVFFSITASIQILRQKLLERKKTKEELKQLSQERNGGK